MATAVLPKHCTTDGLISSLHGAGALSDDWKALVIQIPDEGFLSSGAIAFLCSWGLGQVESGRRLRLRGPDSYLERMDLHHHLGLPHTTGRRHDETGRFMPLRLVGSDRDVLETVNCLCDLVLHQFDDAAGFVPALEWAAYEIVDNILIHSQTPVPGVVCAQYFPKRHRLDVGICDQGIGIMSSLDMNHVSNHANAIETALSRGVTRDNEIGQGNGMAGALEIVNKNRGRIRVWTGDAMYLAKDGGQSQFASIPAVPGTGVLLQLDTRHKVNLQDTWIAGGDWTFINAEAERVAEGGGFKVAETCLNTGTRPPAERLRRKILALMPEIEGPTTIDFTGVHRASSSFLDELLGRLANHLGEAEFNSHIRITGMDPTIRRMANVVIAQRIGHDSDWAHTVG